MKKANKNKASEPLTVIAKMQTYKFRRKICMHVIFYTNIFKNANKKLKKIKIFLYGGGAENIITGFERNLLLCLTNFFYCYIIKILSVCSGVTKKFSEVFFMKRYS